MERVVYLDRPMCEEINIEWTTQSRADITKQLNEISDNIVVHLPENELTKLGYSYDEKLRLEDIVVSKRFEIGKTASDVEPIYLNDLTEEQLDVFGIGKDGDGRYYVKNPSAKLLDEMKLSSGKRAYFSDMNSKAFKVYNKSNVDDYGNALFNVKKDDSVYLKTLTDEQLEMLGVPESGDVMSFNGKICFRFYIAELEEYFDVDSRHFSVDLLS